MPIFMIYYLALLFVVGFVATGSFFTAAFLAAVDCEDVDDFAEEFGVSKMAASIRLRNLGLI